MTTPVTPVTKPTKTWVATVGAVLTVVVPLVTSVLTYLPPEWAAVITGIIGVLTVLGVYTVPNKPTGEVVVDAGVTATTLPATTAESIHVKVTDAGGDGSSGYTHPWK